VIEESLGFITRVLAMIVNLACDMAQQQIASVDDINEAVKLGLGYPHGPIEWGDLVGREKYYAYWKEYQPLAMTRVIALVLGYSGGAAS
jgi:3-hydroxyacyl-CoA dehydrogenase